MARSGLRGRVAGEASRPSVKVLDYERRFEWESLDLDAKVRAVLGGSELQTTIESQLRNLEDLVEVAGAEALAFSGPVRFLPRPSSLAVSCQHCGRPFFRASLPFHQERCAQRPANAPAPAAPARSGSQLLASDEAESFAQLPVSPPRKPEGAMPREAPHRAVPSDAHDGGRAAELSDDLGLPADPSQRPRPRELGDRPGASRAGVGPVFFSIATPPVTPGALEAVVNERAASCPAPLARLAALRREMRAVRAEFLQA